MRAMTTEGLPVISPNRGSRNNLLKSTTPTPNSRSRLPKLHDDYSSYRLRTLNQQIKNNDVSSILKDNRSALALSRNSHTVIKDDVKDISNNVLALRKRYNEIREDCVRTEQETFKMRAEIDKLKGKESNIVETQVNTHSTFEQLKVALDMQQIKVEEALEMKRVYAHMLDRLKKDKISDQIKAYHLQLHLTKENHELYVEQQKSVKAEDFEHQAKVVFNGVLRQIEVESKQRQESLNVFERTLDAQDEADQNRSDRIYKNQLIYEKSKNDLKDSNESRWRELQLVHKFITFFLKCKIDREIKQYEKIEQTYNRIKAATGLVDAREIVSRFVGREQTYSELLISIADYERKIGEARKSNEQLRAKVQSLKEQNVPIERSKEDKVISKALEQTYKDLEVVNEVCHKSKLIVEKTHSWALQTLVKIDKAKKIINKNYYEELPKNNLAKAFCRVIEAIRADLATIKEQDVAKVLDEIDNTKIDLGVKNKEFMAKNMRVRPTIQKYDTTRRTDTADPSKRSFQIDEIDVPTKDEFKDEAKAEIEAQKNEYKSRLLDSEPLRSRKALGHH